MSRMALSPKRPARETQTLCSRASARSIDAARSIVLSALTQQPQQKGLLNVQTVLRLVVHHRGRPIHDVVGDLLVSVSRQAVHGYRVGRSVRHQRVVDLVGPEA